MNTVETDKPLSGNDFYVKIKTQNGRIKKRMDELGYKTLAELCRKSGASYADACAIVNFRASPRFKLTGAFRSPALLLSDALYMSPEELFPLHLDRQLPSNERGLFLSVSQAKGLCPSPANLPNPEQALIQKEENDSENGSLEIAMRTCLTPREETCLKMAYGINQPEKKQADIGRHFAICSQRAHQIRVKAERKLKKYFSHRGKTSYENTTI